MKIVDLFYTLTRENIYLKAFFYGKSYEKGEGNEYHPLLWLDDPIYGSNFNNILTWNVNFDILDIPSCEYPVSVVQGNCLKIGLAIIEKIKKPSRRQGIEFDTFSFITLRDYYDNKAAGIRFTLTLKTPNPVDICKDDFDPNKQFPDNNQLPDIDTSNKEGCAVFSDKFELPKFNLR